MLETLGNVTPVTETLAIAVGGPLMQELTRLYVQGTIVLEPLLHRNQRCPFAMWGPSDLQFVEGTVGHPPEDYTGVTYKSYEDYCKNKGRKFEIPQDF